MPDSPENGPVPIGPSIDYTLKRVGLLKEHADAVIDIQTVRHATESVPYCPARRTYCPARRTLCSAPHISKLVISQFDFPIPN